jgi:hypothetical protein
VGVPVGVWGCERGCKCGAGGGCGCGCTRVCGCGCVGVWGCERGCKRGCGLGGGREGGEGVPWQGAGGQVCDWALKGWVDGWGGVS